MRPAWRGGGVVLGVIVILRGFGVTAEVGPRTHHTMAIGFAEALVPVFVAFGCLTIAWLLVALGMRRQSA